MILELTKKIKKVNCLECTDKFVPEEGIKHPFEKNEFFCSKDCLIIYIQNLIDVVVSEYEVKFDSVLTKEIEEHIRDEKEEKENLFVSDIIEREKQSSYDKGYDEGFMSGYLESERKSKLCPVCNQKFIESLHHIRPRKYGGYTTVQNIIGLCNKCHDDVEEKTEDIIQLWKKQNKEINVSSLKHYILNGFPNLEEVK